MILSEECLQWFLPTYTAIQAAETYNKVDLDDSTMTVIVTEQETKNQDEDNEPGCSRLIKRFNKQTFI